MRPAAFLDRDGTLVEEVDHLARPGQLRVLPGVVDALHALAARGYALAIVTNQAGVAKGLFTLGDVEEVHAHLRHLLGVPIDAIEFCPHHPAGIVPEFTRACDCRKPAPGMLARAAASLDIDLARSFMVGDTWSDVAAGEALGLPSYLVRTGHGARAARERPAFGRARADLAEVVAEVLR
jgi:D-glycero-D-manno-heptose 1,7-bisphosphate phosphatase